MLSSVLLALVACMRARVSARVPSARPVFSVVPSSASLARGVGAPVGSLTAPFITSPHLHGGHPTPSLSQAVPFGMRPRVSVLSSLILPLFSVVPASASRARAVGTPLGPLIAPCFTSSDLHGGQPTPSPSQGFPLGRVRALHKFSLLSLPRVSASLAPRASPLWSSALLDTLLNGEVPCAKVSLHLDSPPLAPLCSHLSLSPVLLARAFAEAVTCDSVPRSDLLTIPDSSPLSLVECSIRSLLLTPTAASLCYCGSHYYFERCLAFYYLFSADWVRLVDYEFVWSRWFPSSLSIRPRFRCGPQPSKHVLVALGVVAHSLVFTPEGRQGVLLSVYLPLFCQSFAWCAEEALSGTVSDLIRESSQFIFCYVFFSTILTLFAHIDFTLSLPFIVGVVSGRGVWPAVAPFSRAASSVSHVCSCGCPFRPTSLWVSLCVSAVRATTRAALVITRASSLGLSSQMLQSLQAPQVRRLRLLWGRRARTFCLSRGFRF